jgi:emfourin
VGAGRHHARVAAGLSRPTYARIVRVSVVRGGGFGGLVRATAADTRRLSPGDRDKLVALVRQAGLLDAPAGSGSGRGPGEPEPDRFTYSVTVEDEGLRREVRFSERSLTDAVRNLISWVGSVDGHEESIEGPGGAERPKS